jgi:hypothetical protein
MHNQLNATQTRLSDEKNLRDSVQLLHEQRFQQYQSKIDDLEQDNSSLRHKVLLDKEMAESRITMMQSQLDHKDATIIELQVSCYAMMLLKLFFDWYIL